MLEKGLVQVYTGDRKGKTTAAFGLAPRAADRGNRVLVHQFLKPPSLELGERLGVERSGLPLHVEALDAPRDVFHPLQRKQDRPEVVTGVRAALARPTEIAARRSYDVLILDEIALCLATKMAAFEDIKRLVEQQAPRVEPALTGRGPCPNSSSRRIRSRRCIRSGVRSTGVSAPGRG